MAILMPKDTRELLGPNAAKCEGRSLYFDRFADPHAKDAERNAWFQQAVDKKPVPVKMEAWKNWLGNSGLCLKPGEILLAKLQSRLMVNMAGGVMENAGLCLDRFGVPYVPGSAVKGCARRTAMQTLLEAREAQEPAVRLARLLADIALVFGWGAQDWSDKKKDGKFVSDFAYALGVANWNGVISHTQSILPKVDQFGGAISFLPAYPLQLPANDLELDVLTCHHPKYYQDDKKMPIALDTEEPIPVKFPAFAANIIFQFAVLPAHSLGRSLSQTDSKLQEQALEWLRQGLEIFGIGAKTAAGYGWFDASKELNRDIVQREVLEADRLLKRKEEEAETLRRKKQEEDRIKQIDQEKQKLASLTPDQQEDYKLAQLTPDQFRSRIDNFLAIQVEAEKQAVLRALRLESSASGSRRIFWDELKAKALKKGGKPAQIQQSIRLLSKQMFPGKEGKMP